MDKLKILALDVAWWALLPVAWPSWAMVCLYGALANKRTEIQSRRVRSEADLAEVAWGVIANAGGGDWTRETKEWQEAAAKFRERYHDLLRRL